MKSSSATADVVVVGAGVIGAGIAWRIAQRGLRVTVCDARPGSGASWTAAGMLAPLSELHHGEAPLLALNLESAHRYPEFVAELRECTGSDVGYRRCGTVVAAWDSADLGELRALATFANSLGRPGQMLTGRELRALVPHLAPGLPGGFFAAGDHQVDNRAMHRALVAAVQALPGTDVVLDHVTSAVVEQGRVAGVQLAGGARIDCAVVVLAAGAWTGTLAGLPPDALPTVRPVKGQTVRLSIPAAAAPDLIVRASVKGSPVYVVPRADGELVVGASSEEVGFDAEPRAGAIYELLRDAQSILPTLSEARFVEVSTSLRPGSPDNAPMIGESDLPGLVVATGHYRNGILLTPLTADAVASVVVDGVVPDSIRPFTPARFRRQAVTA